MAGLSLREAAEQTGKSKSTILRAIQSGRLSAPRNDDGDYSIDPAELFRVYAPRSAGAPDRDTGQDATAMAVKMDLKIRNAQLEAVVNALKAILENEKKRGEELRTERDRWATQAERLAAPAPAPARPVIPTSLPSPAPERRKLLAWLKAA